MSISRTPIYNMTEDMLKRLYNNLFSSYCTELTDWRAQCRENEDMFFGNQQTEAEKQRLVDRNQFVISINKIRTTINDMANILTANMPEFKTNPMGERDTIESDIYNRIMKWVFNNSKGKLFVRQYVKSALRDNMSWAYIYYQDGKVLVKRLKYDEVIVDKSASDIMLSDARFAYIERYMAEDEVKAIYGIEDVTYGLPEAVSGMVSDTGFIVQMQKLYDEDSKYVRLFEGFRKESYRTEDGSVKTKIILETIIGTSHVIRQDMDLAITEIPLVPMFAEDTDSPYKIGEAFFLGQLQKFLNKSYGVVLLNAMNTSSSKIFLRESDLIGNDVNKLRRDYNNPGNIIILAGDSQNASPPTIVSGQPLNQAFFSLYQDAKQQMQASTIPDQFSAANSTTEQKVEMEQYYEKAINRLKHISLIMEEALSTIGRICIQFVKAYVPQETVLSIVDKDKLEDLISLNNSVNFDNEESVAQYQQQLEQKIGAPKAEAKILSLKSMYKYAKVANTIVNNVKDLSEDICVVSGSYEPTWLTNKFFLMLDLFKLGLIQDKRSVLQNAPISNISEILDREDIIEQLASQMQQANDQMEAMTKENESMKKQLSDSGIEMLNVEHTAKLDKQYADTRVALRLQKEKQKMSIIDKVKTTNFNIENKNKEKYIQKLEAIIGEKQQDTLNLNDLINLIEE